MMKTSPARTEDLPPPLIMFPRSKSNRRSRSRTNPMFIRKLNTTNEVNLEPSSPKVTCIGQVKVKRLNKQPTAAVRRKWLRRLNPRWLRVSFFRFDCCRKPEKVQEPEVSEIGREIGDCDDELVMETNCSPPRDAFLLTRSRSAPYRCSSSGGDGILELDGEIGENLGDEMAVKEGNEEDEGFVDEIEVNLSRCKSVPASIGDKLFMSLTS